MGCKRQSDQKSHRLFGNASCAPGLLSGAQLLVSIVALPTLLLLGLLETAFHLSTCSSHTLDTLKATLLALDMQFYLFIPLSFAGIFLPYSATEKIGAALENCQQPLWDCLQPRTS